MPVPCIGTNQTLGGSDILLDTSTESSLGPGNSRTVYGFVDFANYDFGPGYILMVADANGGVVESNENNNVTVIPNFSIPTFDGADLVVNSASGFQHVQPGDVVTLSATVENIGTDPTVGSSQLGIYISDTSAFDPPPPPGQTTLLDTVSINTISAGGSTTLNSIQVTIPGSTVDGEYELGYVADYYNTVPEADENNNLFRTRIFVGDALPAPTFVTASDGTYDDRVRISWVTDYPNATGYEVWRHTQNDSSQAERIYLCSICGPGNASFTDYAVATGVTYYYWIKIFNNFGVPSGFSETDSGYSLDVNATDGTFTDKVQVTWSAVSSATSYEVWRSTEINSWTATLIASSLTGTSYDDTTAVAETTYYYWVKAITPAVADNLSEPDSGYRALPPDIRVEFNGTLYADGSTFTFPDKSVDDLPISRLFDLCNDGPGDLIINNPNTLVSGTGFTQIGTSPVSTVAPGTCTTFRVRFHVNTPNTYTGAITIENNDPAKQIYNILLEGTALPGATSSNAVLLPL